MSKELELEFENAVVLYQIILENENLFSAAVLLAALDLREVIMEVLNF